MHISALNPGLNISSPELSNNLVGELIRALINFLTIDSVWTEKLIFISFLILFFFFEM